MDASCLYVVQRIPVLMCFISGGKYSTMEGLGPYLEKDRKCVAVGRLASSQIMLSWLVV